MSGKRSNEACMIMESKSRSKPLSVHAIYHDNDLYHHIRLTHVISSFSHILTVHRHTDAYYTMVPIQYLLQGQSLFGQGIIGQPQFYGANMATNFIAPWFGNIPWYFGVYPTRRYLEIGWCVLVFPQFQT